MSTELSLLNLYNFSPENFSKPLEEISRDIQHLDWCVDVVNISDFPVGKDIAQIKKTLADVEERLEQILPLTLRHYEQLYFLNRTLDEVKQKMPSQFRMTIKKTVELIEIILRCGSPKHKIISQLDRDYENEPNLISKLLTHTSNQRKEYVKKNI